MWLLSLRLNSQKHHKIPQAQNITVLRSSFSICVCHANEGLVGLRRQVTLIRSTLSVYLIVVTECSTGRWEDLKAFFDFFPPDFLSRSRQILTLFDRNTLFFFHLEIEKFEGDELRKDGEVKKYLDIISNKNVKLSERVLIPVQQYPKVRPRCSMQRTKEWWRECQINVIVIWRSERIESNSLALWDRCALGNDLMRSVSGRSKLDGVRIWFVLHCRSAFIYTLYFCPASWLSQSNSHATTASSCSNIILPHLVIRKLI